MSEALATISHNDSALASLPAVTLTPLDQNPAAVYLASLGAGSRPTMRTALNTIAAILGVAEHRDLEGHDRRFLDVPWAALRYQHTARVSRLSNAGADLNCTSVDAQRS